jgi:hypothetical protein
MQNAGEVLRAFVKGTMALLESRANLKTAFRLDQTTVLPRHNNPIKLSANTRDSIKQLLVGQEGEYLGPRDAVQEVCRDLLFHQDSFLEAMSTAFNEFADKFDPEELAETFDHNLNSNFLTRWRNKSKYWPMYRDLYPILTEKGSGRFPQMFAEEFVTAYERLIAEYKRHGSELLKETVIMKESDLVTDPAVTDLAETDTFADDAFDLEDDVFDLQDDAIDLEDNAIDLNESAKLVLKELEELEQKENSAIEQLDEGDDYKETVAFEGLSLDDLPDDEPDRAEG